MFGFRPDGRGIKVADPIINATPLIMRKRSDAQVFIRNHTDYQVLADYIRSMRERGYSNITFMNLIIAAFVRAASQYPEINRFVVGTRIYVRSELTVAFTLLRSTADDTIQETATKIHFDPTDTIFDVTARVQAEINKNRDPVKENNTLRLASALLRMPLLPSAFVGLLKLLDLYGLLPKFIIDLSPFHTSMFITNMASIGMKTVYHHIYNFGSTSSFFSLGTLDRIIDVDENKKLCIKRVLPITTTVDERVCAGATWARAVALMRKCLQSPELLEVPPETVRYEGKAYHVPKPVCESLPTDAAEPAAAAI